MGNPAVMSVPASGQHLHECDISRREYQKTLMSAVWDTSTI